MPPNFKSNVTNITTAKSQRTLRRWARLSVQWNSNHSIRRQVKGDTWRGHVLYILVVTKWPRNDETREPLLWRRVSRLNWVGGCGEAKHKSRPNCKTNTRGWVKCRVRRDIDTRSRKSRFFSSSLSFRSRLFTAMSYRNYAFYYWNSEIHFAFISRDFPYTC